MSVTYNPLLPQCADLVCTHAPSWISDRIILTRFNKYLYIHHKYIYIYRTRQQSLPSCLQLNALTKSHQPIFANSRLSFESVGKVPPTSWELAEIELETEKLVSAPATLISSYALPHNIFLSCLVPYASIYPTYSNPTLLTKWAKKKGTGATPQERRTLLLVFALSAFSFFFHISSFSSFSAFLPFPLSP